MVNCQSIVSVPSSKGDKSLHVCASRPGGDELIALDEALDRLAMMNERQASVFGLGYFSGPTIEETASALLVSVPTVNRDWTTARISLYLEVKQVLGQV